MILIGSSSDQSGNGMFSKSARKLHMMFMNLKDRNPMMPGKFVNAAKRSPGEPSFDLRQTGDYSNRKASMKAKKKTIFEGSVSREAIQEIQSKQNTAPLYGNYNPKIVDRKIKILRNYNFENPVSDSKHSMLGSVVRQCAANTPQDFNLTGFIPVVNRPQRGTTHCPLRPSTDVQKSQTLTRLTYLNAIGDSSGTCRKFEKENRKVTPQTTKASNYKRLLGNIDFGKQTDRPTFSTKSMFDPTVNLTQTYISLKKDRTKADLHIRSSNSQQTVCRSIQQRNNYELEIKRALIVKKTDLLVPDFARDTCQRPRTCVNFCLNKGFYDVSFPDKYIRGPDMQRMLARGK